MKKEKICRLFVLFLLFSVPLFYFPYADEPFYLPKWCLVQLGAAVVLGVFVISFMSSGCMLGFSSFLEKFLREVKSCSIYFRMAGVYICVFVISLIVNDSLIINVDSLLKLISCIILAYFVSVVIKSPCNIKRMLYVIVLVIVITSVYCIMQYFGFDPLFVPTEREMSGYLVAGGFMGNPDCCAAAIAISVPITVVLVLLNSKFGRKGKGFFFGLMLVTLLVAVYLTSSRAAILGVLLGMIYFFLMGVFLYKKKIVRGYFVFLFLIVFCSFIVLCFNFFVRGGISCTCAGKSSVFARQAIAGREIQWRVALKMFFEHPFMGIGPGNYERKYRRYEASIIKEMNTYYGGGQRASYVHNEYLQMAVDTGICGMLVLLGVLLVFINDIVKIARWVIKSKIKEKDALILVSVVSSIFIVLAISFVHFPLHSPTSALFFACICGVFVRLRRLFNEGS